MHSYLYRVLEVDDDGDPLDFGMLRAADPDDAYAMILGRLHSIGLSGEIEVRLCLVDEIPRGIFPSTMSPTRPEALMPHTDRMLDVPDDLP